MNGQVPLLTTFQAKALLAFNPTSLLARSIELSGTVKRTVGGTSETGNVRLEANASGLEQETWSLSSGDRSVSKAALADGRSCSSSIAGTTKNSGDPNCFRQVPWFVPSVVLWELSTAMVTVQDATTSADTSAGVVRLRFTPVLPVTTSVPEAFVKEIDSFNAAAASDLVFDSQTGLIQRMEYRSYVNSDPASSLEVRITYAGYQLDSGVMVPHHVQRFVQHALESDLQITNVTLR